MKMMVILFLLVLGLYNYGEIIRKWEVRWVLFLFVNGII